MTEVLVVNRDRAVADHAAAMLRQAGYTVVVCAGPTADPCPVMRSLPCPLVDHADVLVYDAWVAGYSDGGRRLVTELRETYADLPVVLTSVDRPLEWIQIEGPYRVTPLVGVPTRERLVAAIETALSEQGMAV